LSAHGCRRVAQQLGGLKIVRGIRLETGRSTLTITKVRRMGGGWAADGRWMDRQQRPTA
jgi:uncharacterized protein YerC